MRRPTLMSKRYIKRGSDSPVLNTQTSSSGINRNHIVTFNMSLAQHVDPWIDDVP